MTPARPELRVVDATGLRAFVPCRTAVMAASSSGVSRDAAWAVWRDWPDPGSGPHPANCACCAPDRALERALAALFIDHVQGRVPAFDHAVVLVAAGHEARVAAACGKSALISARYVLAFPRCASGLLAR